MIEDPNIPDDVLELADAAVEAEGLTWAEALTPNVLGDLYLKRCRVMRRLHGHGLSACMIGRVMHVDHTSVLGAITRGVQVRCSGVTAYGKRCRMLGEPGEDGAYLCGWHNGERKPCTTERDTERRVPAGRECA